MKRGIAYDRFCGRGPAYIITHSNHVVLFLRSDSYPYSPDKKNFIFVAEKTRGKTFSF